MIDRRNIDLEYQNKHLIGEDGNFIRTNHYPLYRILRVKNDVKDFFVFAFVRNPFDRLVSEYYYQKLNKNIPFNDYIIHIVKPAFDFGKLEEWFSFHLLPQIDFISVNGQIRCDFLGRFESLEDDYKKVCKILGIEQESLSHYKKSMRKDYRCYYNDESRAIVEKYYQKDLAEFDYTF
jgi:Sulfotransferase family